jgi:predicted acyl esterase
MQWVPMQDEGGRTHLLSTRICRPAGDAPARVVLINHGKPNDPDVAKVKPAPCGNEAVQWFLARGYIVVAGVRRGYGATGGDLAESSRSCSAQDLVHAARGRATSMPCCATRRRSPMPGRTVSWWSASPWADG